MNEFKEEKQEQDIHITVESPQRNNDGTALMVIAWVMFALAFVPFLPFKTALAVIGVVLGVVYKNNYNGSIAPFVANLVMLVFRLAWVLILAAFIAAL